MFVLGAFVVSLGGAGAGPRGGGAAGRGGPVGAGRVRVRSIRRNRRRYGGYIVHLGLAVLLIGVAASSSFQHSSDVALRPGQHVNVDGYRVSYVKPTAAVSPQRISFGAVLDVSKGGKHVTTLRTARGFYPSQDSVVRADRAVLRRERRQRRRD